MFSSFIVKIRFLFNSFPYFFNGWFPDFQKYLFPIFFMFLVVYVIRLFKRLIY